MKVHSFVFCGEAKSLKLCFEKKTSSKFHHFRKRGLFKAELGRGWGITGTPFFEETLEDPTHLISSESAATSNTYGTATSPRQQLHPSPHKGETPKAFLIRRKTTVDAGGSSSARGLIEVSILQYRSRLETARS